jgi:hypothetical protein
MLLSRGRCALARADLLRRRCARVLVGASRSGRPATPTGARTRNATVVGNVGWLPWGMDRPWQGLLAGRTHLRDIRVARRTGLAAVSAVHKDIGG